MFRLLLLLIVMAGVGAYFTKPDRAAHERAAEAALRQARDAAASAFDIGGVLNLGVAGLAGEGRYEDFYLASKYTLRVEGRDVMQCWGAFAQVRCMPAAPTAAAS
ncbi:MAG TPA: hypothetical protein VG841_03065 [Caulobacterales bacterium]|nr:hypothetical protein [Caulobacterales bacterium]